VSTTPGDTTMTVAFAAPADTGSSSILSYTVTATDLTNPPTGQKPVCIYDVATDDGLSCRVQGLTDGDSYTFTVSAANSSGVGPDSPPSAPATPAALPGVPTGVTTTQGNGHITIAWSAPLSDGGSPITGYTATAVGTAHSCTAISPGTDSCEIAGLTTGSTYTFMVTSTSVAGTSGPSSATTPVMEVTAPSAPSAVKAKRGAPQQITVSWTPPASDGSSSILYYVGIATDSATSAQLTCTHFTVIPFNNCIIPNLMNGDTYTVTVVAHNAVGDAVASAPSKPVIPATVGFAPIDVTGIPGNHEVTVSWTPSPDDGGLPATSFSVTASGSAVRGCTYVVPASPATLTDSCVVMGLINGSQYTFTVIATNPAGPSPSSAPSVAVTPATIPGAPSAVVAQRGIASVTLHRTAPVSSGGSPLTGYKVTASAASTPSRPALRPATRAW
jgi:hypothetical protein